ncbi:hypothetical protein L7F22_002065 [Adiantum nelumboides]|nr:hypothetical protein [Adiantum nelumboides]
MAAGSTQDSLRKVLGAIKDSTKVGLAQINSEYKDLDIAIVKATNHVEGPPKEKHIRTIFAATSASRPRADVAYCIHALARRVSKTHNWTVALKSLLVIHRSLREGDPTFREELINYSRSRRLAFNLSNFKDDSSPSAWDYSAWVRTYALYLEERLECFRLLKYDLDSDRILRIKELDTIDLLEQLPALQELLYRLMGCQPEGAAYTNYIIQYALNLVLKESIRIYQAINDGMINLVDKFFEMQRFDAIKALEIYKRGGQQTQRLSEFYDACKGLEFSRSMKLPPLEQPPQSFLTSMEQYVRDAPRQSSFTRKDSLDDKDGQGTKKILALEYKPAEPEEPRAPPEPTQPIENNTRAPDPVSAAAPEKVDFLGLDDAKVDPSVLEESNALALAIVPESNGTSVENGKALDMETGVTGWELALVTTTSSNDSALSQSKLAGGFDKLTLDSLYDDALNRQAYAAAANNSMGYMSPNPFAGNAIVPAPQQDPFLASTKVAPPPNVQLATLAQQQQAMMMQQQAMMMQQQMMGGGQHVNPYSYGMPYAMPISNPYQTQPQSNPFGNPGLL